jgi:hypothetical protein
MSGLVALGFGAALLPLGVIILAIVAIAGGRSEPDPLHERPATLYLTAVSFFAVFAVLFAVFGLASSALNLTVDHHSTGTSFFSSSSQSRSCSGDSSGNITCGNGVSSGAPLILERGQHDGDYRGIVIALIAGVLAALLFLLHYRWLRRYLADRVDGPGVRVWHTYLYVACFFAIAVAIPSVGALIYDVVRVIAPGVTNTGARSEALVSFGSTSVLAAGAGIVFLFHWNQAPLSTSVGVTPFAPAPPPAPPESAPPPPPPAPAPTPAPAPVARVRKATKATKTTKKQ